jgi:hypothetical protein
MPIRLIVVIARLITSAVGQLLIEKHLEASVQARDCLSLYDSGSSEMGVVSVIMFTPATSSTEDLAHALLKRVSVICTGGSGDELNVNMLL